MHKTKILYIHHGRGIGGAPLSLLYLIKGLDTTLYHPVVLFLHYSEAMDLYRAQGIEVYGPVTRSDFSHTVIWWYRWYHVKHLVGAVVDTIKLMFGEAESWLKAINPDIVHLNTSSLIAWGYAAQKLQIPVVQHIREPLAYGYFGFRRFILQKLVAKYATAILPISNNDAMPWQTDAKTKVVYNAVPKDLFMPAVTVTQKTEPIVLYVGGLSREKGTLLLFKLFEKVLQAYPAAKLFVAGKFDLSLRDSIFSLKRFFGEAPFKVQVATQFAKIKDSVVLLGVSSTIPALMQQSRCIVFPATVGHFARPIIEAGFMAKPVVASKLAPLDELVVDGKTGFLVDPTNEGLWVKKIVELLEDEALAEQMGKEGFIFATQKFSIPYQIEQISKVYKTL